MLPTNSAIDPFFQEAAQWQTEYLRLRPSNAAKERAFRAMDLWADALREAKRFDEALAVVHRAMPIIENLLQAEPDNPAYLRQKMAMVAAEGSIYDVDTGRCLGRSHEAVVAVRLHLALAQKLAAMDRDNASARLSLAIAYYQLSWPLGTIDPAESVRAAANGLHILEADLLRAPQDRVLRSRSARALRHFAYALNRVGNSAAALKTVERAIVRQASLVA